MLQLLTIATIILGCTVTTQGISYVSYGRCSYTGDPHLIPFPSVWNETMNMYYCQKPGWEVLLQNPWVLVVVNVGPNPYVILDYVVMFYNGSQHISCVLVGSSGLSTCTSGSSIVSITNPGGTSWNHVYPAAQYLNIQISSFAWGSGRRYDINIRQTMQLIQQSTGICIKWDCPLERILATPTPVVVKICEAYLDSARKRALGQVNDVTIKYMVTACQNDLIVAFNPKLARTLVGQVIHHSLDKIDGEKYQNAVVKAESNIRGALAEADRLAAAVIGRGEACWEQKRCLDHGDD